MSVSGDTHTSLSNVDPDPSGAVGPVPAAFLYSGRMFGFLLRVFCFIISAVSNIRLKDDSGRLG